MATVFTLTQSLHSIVKISAPWFNQNELVKFVDIEQLHIYIILIILKPTLKYESSFELS